MIEDLWISWLVGIWKLVLKVFLLEEMGLSVVERNGVNSRSGGTGGLLRGQTRELVGLATVLG